MFSIIDKNYFKNFKIIRKKNIPSINYEMKKKFIACFDCH